MYKPQVKNKVRIDRYINILVTALFFNKITTVKEKIFIIQPNID